MPPAGRRTDHGVSLTELILAVALLGTAAVTLLGAFGTLIKTGDQSKKSGDVTTTLAAASEFVLDNSRTPYVDCTDGAPYTTALAGFTKPATIGAITVETVQFWNGAGGAFEADCHDTIRFWRLQELTLRVVTLDGRVERTITVVKRG